MSGQGFTSGSKVIVPTTTQSTVGEVGVIDGGTASMDPANLPDKTVLDLGKSS